MKLRNACIMHLQSYLAEKHLDVGNLCNQGATLSAVQSLNANDQPSTSKTKAILAAVGVNRVTL